MDAAGLVRLILIYGGRQCRGECEEKKSEDNMKRKIIYSYKKMVEAEERLCDEE